MNVGAILVGVALLTLAGAYVARPLFEKSSPGSERAAPADGRAQLLARRDAVYALIRELDADYRTGKVNDEDYEAQRGRYVAKGVALLKRLDALSSQDDRAALEAEIEAAVLALRQREPSARFCTQCGRPAAPQDKFCGQCGAPFKKGTAAQ